MSKLRRTGRPLFGLALCLASCATLADIWAFVDEAGVAHVASTQIDSRYELFFRSPKVQETVPSIPPLTAPAPAAQDEVALPDADSVRRRAWVERLPNYRNALGHLRDASERLDLDPHLLTALIVTESGFNPVAVSPKGAMGLMQLMPDTASRYGVARDGLQERKLFDPATNIRAGTSYLRDLLNLFNGSLELALAAYNAGEGAVQRAGNRIPAYRETQDYVRTVLQLYAALRPAPRPRAPEPTPAAAPASPAPPPAILGGALGRGNMITPLTVQPRLPEAGTRN